MLDEPDSLTGETVIEDNWGLAHRTATAGGPARVNDKTPTGGETQSQAAIPPGPSARILMTSSVTIPASRTALLPRSQDNRSLQLITRFAAGAVILGLEELVKRGQKWEEAAPPEVLAGEHGTTTEDDTYGALLRYWTLGMITSARRNAWSLALDALEAPGSVAGLVSRSADRVMGSWLMRPVRQPVSSALNGILNRVVAVSDAWIAEGRREELISRWIASKGIDEIINDVIDMIAENPQLASLVSDQLSQQSMGIASAVADTGRKLGSVGDDLAENFVRKLLRRGLRSEITPITPVEELPPELIRPSK